MSTNNTNSNNMNSKSIKNIGITGRKNISKIVPEQLDTQRKEASNFDFPEYYYDTPYQNLIIRSLYLDLPDLLDTEKKVLTREINKKLASYKQQDIKNEIYSDYHIIKYPDVIQLLLESKMKCKYCRESVFLLYKEVRDPKQWTLDRIDNNFGHNNDNVIICCLDCNLKRRNTNMNKFLFTKQLKISKV